MPSHAISLSSILLLSSPLSLKSYIWSCSFRFHCQNPKPCVHYILSHKCPMSHPFKPWFGQLNDIWWGVQVINPFQSNFSATRILPSSYLFWAGKRLVDYLSVLHEEKRRTGSDSGAGEQTQQKKGLTFSLCNFLHSPVTSSPLVPNIYLSTLFFDIFSLCSSYSITTTFTPTNSST
jgi:hypothetical protein